MTNIFLIFLVLIVSSYAAEEYITTKKFPDNFMLGVATAAIQIEGGWNEDGKGESVWDRAIHSNRSYIKNQDTPDVACDSYHKWQEDIQMLKYLNVTHYRFSISWPRLLPTGHINNINQKAIDYYNKLINGLLENGIKPMITLFHWDTPQAIDDEGGWLNSTVIDSFGDYADLCFKLFGDRVKHWITFNEPKQTCNCGYSGDFLSFPPFIKSPGDAEYVCSYHVVLSHAKAWHIYNETYRSEQQGEVGITVDSSFIQPENPKNASHVKAANDALVFQLGIYLDPLYTGDYAPVMRQIVDTKSRKQGYKDSRLPRFTEKQKRDIKGTLDYLGLNCYTAQIARPQSNPEGKGIRGDPDVNLYQDDKWEHTESAFIYVTPWVCRDLVRWAHNRYNPIKIIITENGVPSNGHKLKDDFRISYHKRYLSKLREVLDEGINLVGYTAWSLMDNFEWVLGYSQKFGLYDIDYESPNRTRTPKKSAEWFRKFIATRCLAKKCHH